MNLLQLNRQRYEIDISPEIFAIDKFKVLINKDKSKDKGLAIKELAFIFFYTDIKSDYMYITDKDKRIEEIIKDLQLPKGWKISKELEDAINLYEERSTTINSALYKSACIAAMEISEYLKGTKTLLEERTDKGAAVTNINSITGALAKVPSIMRDLNTAHQELVKEQKMLEGRKKGSKELNIFEEGFGGDN